MDLTTTTLTSDWGGLNDNLIAGFYEVDRQGKRKPDSPVIVRAALTDANLDAQLSWQSPFEQAGPESKAPTLFAMLQSGKFQPYIDLITGGKTGEGQATRLLQKFEGRTGITRLNSVQVFQGMPPVKFQVTALFRAWRDPVTEVEAPFNQLMEWALPKKLAKDSALVNGLEYLLKKSEKDAVEAILPSESPTLIAMTYKGRTYSPLVIESIGQPLSSPIDSNGNFVELTVPLSLATLTAIDKQDWINIKKGKSLI